MDNLQEKWHLIEEKPLIPQGPSQLSGLCGVVPATVAQPPVTPELSTGHTKGATPETFVYLVRDPVLLCEYT
jgi:hypothetical protein